MPLSHGCPHAVVERLNEWTTGTRTRRWTVHVRAFDHVFALNRRTSKKAVPLAPVLRTPFDPLGEKLLRKKIAG